MIDVLWIVAFRVSQCDIWFRLVFFDVDRLVQKVVDDVVFGRLLADVITRWWHADQMHLMECKTFGADPGVFLVFLTVVEYLATEAFVGVVAGQKITKKCRIFRSFRSF